MNEHVSTVVSPQATDKPDTGGMLVIHRVFRREFRQLADLVLQAPAGDLRRAGEIAGHLDLLTEVLHHHRSGEDEYLWPLLSERATMRADLVHRMEYQHEGLKRYLRDIEILLPRWRRSGAVSVAGELSSTLRLLSKALVEHLDDEEQNILPMVEECLSAAEWTRLAELALAEIPVNQRFTVLGLLLEEASKAEADELIGMLPALARFGWKLNGRRGYARYINRVHGDALL